METRRSVRRFQQGSASSAARSRRWNRRASGTNHCAAMWPVARGVVSMTARDTAEVLDAHPAVTDVILERY